MIPQALSPKGKLCLLAVILITYLTYLPSLFNSFVNWDDYDLLVDNAVVQSLSLQNVKSMATTHLSGRFYPLTILAFAGEYHFFHLSPQYYHLVNLIFHLLNTLLVFWLLCQKLNLSLIVSVLTALLFGIHPLQVEAVAWVSSLKDVLSTFLFLLALLFYLESQEGSRPVNGFYCLSVILLGLSLLAKPLAITFPFIIFLIDYYHNKKIKISSLLTYGPYVILAVFFSWVTLDMARQAQAFPATEMYPALFRPWFSLWAWLFYIGKLIFPLPLSNHYPIDFFIRLTPMMAPVLPAFLFLFIYGLVLLKSRVKGLVLPFLFFCLTISPVLHFIKVNDSLIYERFVYVPSLGIFLLLSVGVEVLLKRFSSLSWPRNAVVLLAAAYILTLTVMSYQRCRIWRDSWTLWTDCLQKFPENPVAYNNRGSAYSEQRQYALAMMDFNQAIRLRSDYALAYYNRGNIAAMYGNYPMAIQDYNQSIQLNPRDIKSYNNRGNMYLLLKKNPSALTDYTYALTLEPANSKIRLNRAMLFYATNDLWHAEVDAFDVLTADPHNELAERLLIEISVRKNKQPIPHSHRP